MTEVRYNDMGNALAECENPEEEELFSTYIAEARRRTIKASLLWRRGGRHKQQVEQMRRIGAYLRKLRDELDLTQTELAERANLNIHVLLLIEGGLVAPEELKPLLGRLAKGLGTSTSELCQVLEVLNTHEETNT